MAKYRVLTKSYINSTIVEAGAIVEYDGKPGSNLELVEAAELKAEVKADAKGKVKGKAPAAPDDAAADLV
jgi:hypothetical protein